MSPITRRQFVGSTLALTLLPGVRESTRAVLASPAVGNRESHLRLYWGDLHNHNALGYGSGSLDRSIEIAREHLDFFAFTGHASWHDMPELPEGRERLWLDGFKAHEDHWPRTRRLMEEANDERFAAFLGYEWHSSHFGDYCMVFSGDEENLFLPDHVEKLLDFAEHRQALAVPHHVAYQQGWRGANFDYFRPSVSPIVEVYSKHGCSEAVHAPYPYVRHSMGGRATHNTIRRQLDRGLRFGFVASSDSHLGYPGAYREGILGVWAENLDRQSLFEAFRAGRTYASTGERIAVDFQINGHPMGSQLPYTRDRQIDVRIEGQDTVQSVELIRNGRIIQRLFPEDAADGPVELPGRVKCQFRYGWGPWARVDLDRACEWDLTVHLSRARLRRVIPCFESAPFGEQFIDRVRVVSDQEVHLHSYTSRVDAFLQEATKALVLDMDAEADGVLELRLSKPVEQRVRASLKDLAKENRVTFTGTFFSESYILEQLIGPAHFSGSARWQDRRGESDGPDYYYVRVNQYNQQHAWSSPIWVG